MTLSIQQETETKDSHGLSFSSRAGVGYINGQILPIDQVRIPILDRGFLHSDATYDVVHVWKGSFFRLNDHLDRFERGMKKLHMSIGLSRADIRRVLARCVAESGLEDAYVAMICTRGLPFSNSRDPRDCVNQFYAFAVPFGWVIRPEDQDKGARLHISTLHRISPSAVDPTVKNYHWLDLIQGQYEAYDHGADLPLLTDGQGNVVEGPGFNVFSIKGTRVATPAAGILEGVTRKTAIELCQSLSLTVEERALPVTEVLDADEVFITSTAGGIMPVRFVNDRELNWPSDHSRQLRERYWDAHRDPRLNETVATVLGSERE